MPNVNSWQGTNPGASVTEYDCIVVGARCAGAALGVYLARSGMRVLILEADALHADQPFSTHVIQALGIDRLEELGVAQRIRAVTPPVRVARMAVREHPVDVTLPEARPMYCPRRSTLDPMLQDAAIGAGVELRVETRVVELLRTGDRVCGVRAQRGGQTAEFRARWVVGADGRSSSVAKLVAARNYIEHTSERAGYWAYYAKPECWDREDPWRKFQTVIRLDDVARFAFECDGGLLMMGVFAAFEQVRAWHGEYRGGLRKQLLASPLTAALAEAEPVTTPVGLLKAHFYVREPFGKGWALVGDAGLHKDPTPGYGITDALCDAKALAQALCVGSDEAMREYWRVRDEHALPMYFQAQNLGALRFVNPFNELFFDRVNRDAGSMANMLEVLERRRSPFEIVPSARFLAWVGSEVLRGRLELVAPFLAAARGKKELERAQARSQELQASAGSRTYTTRSFEPYAAVDA